MNLAPFAPAMTDVEKAKLLAILARVDAALCDEVYCLMWGALLGHVRFGDLNPWDDDIDLLIVDEPPIKELQQRLPDLKVMCYRYTKVFDPKDPPIRSKQHSFPFVELIPAKLDRDDFVRTPTLPGKPDDAFPEDLIFPIHRGIFAGVEVNLPAKPRELVLHKYGPHCLESALPPSWSHKHERRTGYSQERVPLSMVSRGFRWEQWDYTRAPDGKRIRWMDRRHTEFIYHLLMTGRFRRVLEIGCHNGSSTAALVQAVNDGANIDVHLCDPDDNTVLRRVIDSCRLPDRVTYHCACSLTVLPRQPWDLVIVDGNHSLEHVSKELEILLRLEVPNIIGHDVSAKTVGPWAGARRLGDVLRTHPDFRCLVDSVKRSGEWTERGFLFATRDETAMLAASPAWKEMLPCRP